MADSQLFRYEREATGIGMSATLVARIVEAVLMVATILLFVWVALPRTAPWRVVWQSASRTLKSWRRALYLAACLSILLANFAYLQLGVDERFTASVVAARGHDYTADIHRIEGEAVAALQGSLACPPLTWFLGYVYVVVFPCLVFVVLFVFDHMRFRRGLAMVLVGYLFNYLLELPFYLWFPVREVFHFYRHDVGTGAVRLLLDDIHPVVMQAYRAMSGLDNCFPSFHTSLAVTLALVAWHLGRVRFSALITFFAAANVLSTLYLGIHWVCDVSAGLVVGVAAYAIAWALSRWWPGQPAGAAAPPPAA